MRQSVKIQFWPLTGLLIIIGFVTRTLQETQTSRQAPMKDRDRESRMEREDKSTVSARKLVVEPPVTVVLGLCAAAIHDFSRDSLFAVMEFERFEIVVGQAESDCKVTDCGSHVQRVLTRSSVKVRQDIDSRWREGCNPILENPYRFEIHQKNIRDKMRVEVGVRSVVAKDPVLAMVKLAMEIEELALDVIGYGTVSHPMTSSRGKLWRTMFSLSASWLWDASWSSVLPGEGWLHDEFDAPHSVSLRIVNLTLVGLVGYYNCMEYLSCVLSRCVEGFRISPFANIDCD